MTRLLLSQLLLVPMLTAAASAAEPLTLISWNVESGGADPAVIAQQLGELPRAAVYALQEVAARDLARYGAAIRDAHGPSYRFVGSWTGQGDQLLLVYDDTRLTLLETRELYAHGDQLLNDWRHRPPLVGRFVDRATGEEFFVATVHLARGKEELRNSQALGLSSWAAELQTPAIALGDFNFDFEFAAQEVNRSWRHFTDAGVWTWARPAELIDTNWSDHALHPGTREHFAWPSPAATDGRGQGRWGL